MGLKNQHRICIGSGCVTPPSPSPSERAGVRPLPPYRFLMSNRYKSVYFVCFLVAVFSLQGNTMAQQPSKPTAGETKKVVSHKKKHKRKHAKKHVEIIHGSDDDKALENIKSEKNKGKK